MCMFAFLAVDYFTPCLRRMMDRLPDCKAAFESPERLTEKLQQELTALAVQFAAKTGWREKGWGPEDERDAPRQRMPQQKPQRKPSSPATRRKRRGTLFSSSDEEEDHQPDASKLRGVEIPHSTKWCIERQAKQFVLDRDTYGEVKDSLVWWADNAQRWPMLAAVARHSLCVPASSATSERSFSKAGHILRVRRARLTDEHVSQLTLLSWNPDLM